jgi:hypothetical protein
MTTDADDRCTWPRNGRPIRRAELLRLIEENGGPKGLDLWGAIFVGEGPSDDPLDNPIDLSREALAPLAKAYWRATGGSRPPWLWLRDGINLHGAQLQGAVLTYARLQMADLRGAQLQRAVLLHARLKDAYLNDAQLQRADLSHAHLQGIDVYLIGSLEGAHWYGAHLDHTRINGESLGKVIGDETEAREKACARAYHDAKEAYLLLKNNFNQIGRYEDASWAYVKEQQMERMAFYQAWRSHGWKVWRGWGSLWRWLRNWAYELATGYGERVYMPVLWAIVVIVVFAAIYAAAGNIASGDVGALQGQPTHSPATALVHSISAFATIGFNTLEPQGWGAHLLTALEAMFGVGLFALFIFTLGNRMSRS